VDTARAATGPNISDHNGAVTARIGKSHRSPAAGHFLASFSRGSAALADDT